MNLELLKTITILYIEDESALQEEICQNIRPFVKKVIKAKNGQDGLLKFKGNRLSIDLIISDILMPQLNGIDMINAIRELDSDIPVIYTTAFNDSKYILQTIEQGVISYILKPIDVELLLTAITKASVIIENNELKRNLRSMNQDLEEKIKIKTKKLLEQNTLLKEQLQIDELTSLKNRKALSNDIQNIEEPVTILVDIDAFKSINDLYGDTIGNAVLVNVSNLLKEIASQYDFNIYRIGSDEFVLLKNKKSEKCKCEEVAHLISKSINEHSIYILEDEITIRIDVTIGISLDKDSSLQKAAMALKKAKKEKISYKLYTENCSMEKEYQNDIKWTREIEKAIQSKNIVAFYQPIVDKEQKIIKYEALMRIKHGQVIYSPYLFLEISKKVKFYSQLAKIMIVSAFNKAKEIQKNININLSIEDIESHTTVSLIKKLLVEENVAHLITFEIVENESINDYEKIIKFIQMVREFGCSIAIDDFGSGYSNFSYLLKLKPDYIKIDGSLIKDIDINKNSYTITKMINDIAHSMGMKTVAEFVHKKEVYDILLELGIDEFQGYYFGEPQENTL